MPGGEIVKTPSGWADRQSGLVVPGALAQDTAATWAIRQTVTQRQGLATGGVVFTRDDKTGVWQMPGYGTGLDDFYMRALVRGDARNIGVSPVADPLLSTLVAKMAAMASTWQIMLTGRPTPVNRLATIISMANDSHTGAGDFIADYIGTTLVDNRGAFIAQVPLETVAWEKWGEYGMDAIPLDDRPEGMSGDWEPTHYYLDMNARDFRSSRGLWMVDGLHCYPTGNREWPYWIRKERKDKAPAWVLVHRDFGSQIVMHIGSHDKTWRAIGQSPTWRYMNILAQQILLSEMDLEAMLNQPPGGIVWGTGLDSAGQLNDAILSHRQKMEEGGVAYYPGTLFGGSMAENADIKVVKFTEPPAGYDFAQWRMMREDYLTACFFVNVSQIVSRFGEGAFTQTQVTDEIQAETGIAHLRKNLEVVYSYVGTRNVMVTVNWLSDRQKRYQVETFSKMAEGIKRLQESTEGQTFTREEIRAMVEQKAGIDIPNVGPTEETDPVDRSRRVVDGDEEDDEDDDNRVTEPVSQMGKGPTLDLVDLPEWIKYAAGNRVETAGRPIEGVLAGRNEDGTLRVRHPWHTLKGTAATYRPEELHLVALKQGE